jgi:hypothetical protein
MTASWIFSGSACILSSVAVLLLPSGFYEDDVRHQQRCRVVVGLSLIAIVFAVLAVAAHT